MSSQEQMQSAGTSDGDHCAAVLCIGDDADQSEAYRIRLEHRGYYVDVAQDAEAAFASMARRLPDVVVLDIVMPGRDGMSILQDLLDADPTLPVILHTAYGSHADNSLTCVADAYVIKSQDISPLVRAIEMSFAHSRHRTARPAWVQPIAETGAPSSRRVSPLAQAVHTRRREASTSSHAAIDL